jgi:hypothetical protein
MRECKRGREGRAQQRGYFLSFCTFHGSLTLPAASVVLKGA